MFSSEKSNKSFPILHVWASHNCRSARSYILVLDHVWDDILSLFEGSSFEQVLLNKFRHAESQKCVSSHNFVWFKFYSMNKNPLEYQFFFIWAIFLFHFMQLCYKWEPDSLAGIISFIPSSSFVLKICFHAFSSLFGMSFYWEKMEKFVFAAELWETQQGA